MAFFLSTTDKASKKTNGKNVQAANKKLEIGQENKTFVDNSLFSDKKYKEELFWTLFMLEKANMLIMISDTFHLHNMKSQSH